MGREAITTVVSVGWFARIRAQRFEAHLRQPVARSRNGQGDLWLLQLAIVGDRDVALAVLLGDAAKGVPVIVVRLLQVQFIHAAQKQVPRLFGLARFGIKASQCVQDRRIVASHL